MAGDDKPLNLKDALNQIAKLTEDSKRATSIGTASVAGALAGAVLATVAVPLVLPVAVAAGSAAVSLFKKLKDRELQDKLLNDTSLTEEQKNLLQKFQHDLQACKTKEDRETLLRDYQQRAALLAQATSTSSADVNVRLRPPEEGK
jgi:CRISPR/Cas system CMR subunit Cmr4 (Cas7 group RAMP superfamily)